MAEDRLNHGNWTRSVTLTCSCGHQVTADNDGAAGMLMHRHRLMEWGGVLPWPPQGVDLDTVRLMGGHFP